MKRKCRVIAAVLASSVVASVGVSAGLFSADIKQIYDGPARPRAEVAVITSTGPADERPGVGEINGRHIHGFPHKYAPSLEVLPGHYELTVWYGRTISAPVTLSLDVEAGKEYEIRARSAQITSTSGLWRPEAVEVPPSTKPRRDRVSTCWMTRYRGTVVVWDRKGRTFTIKDRDTAEPRTFKTGGGFDPFRVVDAAWKEEWIKGDFVGKNVSAFVTGCTKPDVLHAVQLED